MMDVTGFRPWMCLCCGYTMDSASSATKENAVPKEGDISVCLNCGALYALRAGAWAPLGALDMAALPADVRGLVERVQRLRKLVVLADLANRGGRA